MVVLLGKTASPKAEAVFPTSLSWLVGVSGKCKKCQFCVAKLGLRMNQWSFSPFTVHFSPHVAVCALQQWHTGVDHTCSIHFFVLHLWHNQILSWFVAVGKNVLAVNWALVYLHSSVNRIHAVLLYVAAAVFIDQRNNILNWINRRPDTICSSGAAHLILGGKAEPQNTSGKIQSQII